MAHHDLQQMADNIRNRTGAEVTIDRDTLTIEGVSTLTQDRRNGIWTLHCEADHAPTWELELRGDLDIVATAVIAVLMEK